MSKCRVMTWEAFREMCYDDAYAWVVSSDYKPDEVSDDDILSYYADPEFFTEDDEEDDLVVHDDELIVDPEQVVNMTRVYMNTLFNEKLASVLMEENDEEEDE